MKGVPKPPPKFTIAKNADQRLELTAKWPPPLSARRFQSARIGEFRESVIREMTRLALKHGAVNLAQGFPDFPAPADLKAAAQKAIADDFNQYPITWGIKPFRDAICQSYKRFYNLDIDPEREVTVCCGATEGMIASSPRSLESRRRSYRVRTVL